MILLVFCSLFSCQDDHSADAKKEFQKNQTIAFSKNLEVIIGNKVTLTPTAEEKVSNWQEFLNVKTEVGNMKEFTIRDMVQNARNLNEIMKGMETTVPEELKTKPVLTRIAVLKSLTGMLEQLSRDPSAKANDIKKLAEEIPPAFENLKIQINESYRKGLEDFRVESEKDLEPVLAPILKSGSIIQKPGK